MSVAIVAGAVANKPHNGGAAWTRVSWALGLRRLGFHVVFVEEVEPGPHALVAAAWFADVMRWAGLWPEAALLTRGSQSSIGLSRDEVLDRAADAELLLNISGHLRDARVLALPRRRVLVDLDPGYTQTWHAQGLDPGGLAGHDEHLTVGERIGRADCPIPTGGISWRPTRQPVVLDDWPVTGGDRDRFTTVASWRGPLGTIDVEGSPRGGKVHEFRRFAALPAMVSQRCEIALDIDRADDADRRALIDHGWQLRAPRDVAGTPEAFRAYVQASGAELSVAQGVYVAGRTGWLSDRTVRYLASGKPALVQDTGFDERYRTGAGLLPFKTLEEAAAAAAEIAGDYERHSRAARALAEEQFDSDLVLAELLETVEVAA
jgi:hypothetical protein